MRPGRDCWRVEQSDRAAVLIDAESYFCALRAAMLQAERTIHIVGWDLDRRMPFPGCAEDVARLPSLSAAGGNEIAADGYPLRLGEFLAELVKRKPRLWIRILLWDFSLLYAAGRELRPAMALALRWKTPRRLDLCLDDAIPMGSSHHQKLVVIDDALAFCGGMDLSCGRWDDCAHAPQDPRRRLLDGQPYPAVHDVQVMVGGPAAQCVGEYVRSRWVRAAYEKIGNGVEHLARIWPAAMRPDFRNAPVALARTEPGFAGAPAVTEIERLYVRMIRDARRTIYIENQYLTSELVADNLVRALKANPELEAVIVSSKTYPSWVEDAAMVAGRHAFMQRARDGGMDDRIQLLYPCNGAGDSGSEIKVHAKLMIVDDRYLRIGSANICRRSMGTDTEFDLAILGEDEASRAAIIAIRNRLVAEHCGAEPDEVAAALAETGSLRATLRRLNGRQERRLEPIPAVDRPESVPEALVALADPDKPIDPTLSWTGLSAIAGSGGKKALRNKRSWVGLVLAAVALIALASIWTLTPMKAIADVEHWEAMLAAIRGPWEVIAVLVVFVLSGFVAFPVIVLIAGTTAVFGVWPGMLYAGIGAMASALATYSIGWWLGQRRLRRYFGPSVNRIKQSLEGRGIITMTTIRLIPAAPYTLVNLAAGALRIPPLDYTVGTALGLAPGILVMSLLGSTIVGIIAHPTVGGVALLVALLVATILLSIGLQVIVRRLQRMFG